MTVPQKPLQAPAAVKQTYSVMKQTAALVSPWLCLTLQKTLCQERLVWRLFQFKKEYPAWAQFWVPLLLPQNVHSSQSQRVMLHLRNEQEWARSLRVKSLHHCHHHHHLHLATVLNRGAANVAIAAKPNWSWCSRSWVPVAVVMFSVWSIVFQSNTSVSLTTWAVDVRRLSSRWSSLTVKWAALASALARSAHEQPPPHRPAKPLCSGGVSALIGICFSSFSPHLVFQGFYRYFGYKPPISPF